MKMPAKAKKKTTAVKLVGTAGAGVAEKTVLFLTRKYIKEYGSEVIENRALPDYRDGLKPVHRRILWAAHLMGLKFNVPHRKSARLVGDVIGKYHPHGDVSVYDAMVNMEKTHLPVGMLDGQGNWGSVTDNAAAMRYTEVRLSKYANECMVPKDYINIIPYVPNFDGHEKEPVFLPALYPNLLLNGTFGIAVGVTGGIPPLHIESLMPLIEMVAEGKTLSTKIMKKHLRFNYRYQPVCSSVDDDITNWLETGSGGIVFSPKVHYDEDARQITFTNVPPFFNWDVVVKRLSKYEKIISKIENQQDKKIKLPQFSVKLKNTVDPDDLRHAAKPIVKAFDITVRMATNITIRSVNEIEEVAQAEFDPTTPTNLIALWTQYRVKLEQDYQAYRMQELSKAIAYQELMLLATINRKVIIESLDNREPETILVKKLKITPEQAETILNLQVRRLSKMSGEEIKGKIKELKSDKETANKHFKSPAKKAIADMSAGMANVK